MTSAPTVAAPTRLTIQEATEQLGIEILDDWLRHLRVLLLDIDFEHTTYRNPQPHLQDTPTRPTLWLTCDFSMRGIYTKHVQRASESIALLNLLSDLDTRMWKAAVELILPILKLKLNIAPAPYDVLANPPLLGLLVSVSKAEHVEWITERVVGVEPSSRPYRDAIGAVEKAFQANGRALPRPAHRIPVIVRYNTQYAQ